MAIAEKLKDYLQQRGIEYELIEHSHTGSSMQTAEVAHIPGDNLAKSVVVKEGEEYLLVVIPADYHVELESLERLLQRKVALASEQEIGKLFPDCELGAVPPIGAAYGIKEIWDPDTSLGTANEVYFEAGDHERVVRVSGENFHELMAQAERGQFSHHV